MWLCCMPTQVPADRLSGIIRVITQLDPAVLSSLLNIISGVR